MCSRHHQQATERGVVRNPLLNTVNSLLSLGNVPNTFQAGSYEPLMKQLD